ncbi:nucleotidyltransferase family protein [Priestia megaterium]|uniref:nucleotidyltransferase family protein n=1 Tax=Priestia megaterium TaxID=1404 RepID=UPI001BEC8C62|nr:nucleotidyltransferase family protein [Priestia megaterium]MBT2257906.1 nucleotidyltransferase family protein [Priestia megaterium]MBT2277703.1 nucleotidyltransferase family protein [Priestia megaterium]
MFIEFIQSLYDQSRPLPENPDDYTSILEDIEYFHLSATIYALLKQQGRMEQTPTYFRNQLKTEYQAVLYNNLYIKNQLKLILDMFEANDICAIPLKGILFNETYFGHFSARRTTDIDILIRKEDMEKAIRCIEELEYDTEGEYSSHHFHRSFGKAIPHSPVPLAIELHWDLLKEESSSLEIEQFWKHSTPLEGYKYIKQLSEVHTFYMISLHGWKHGMDSLKYFIDIIQAIHVLNHKIDYDALFKMAKNDQTLKRLTSTLTVVYNQFPHLNQINSLPFNKKSKIWWNYQEIRYGDRQSVKGFKNLIRVHLSEYDQFKHSMIFFKRWLFPKKSEITNLYPPSTKHKKYKIFRGYIKFYQKKFHTLFRALFYSKVKS